MSVDGTKLLFEGFLQKRKDTLKVRWVTYWFRLQNTTLFFYTKKNGSASNLRSYYYIYMVQSVREVQRAERNRFMFEIIMTNGKRKLLAAETAALRKEWLGHLWQAMHLSTSWVSDSSDTHLEVCEQRNRLNSSTPASSRSDSELELLPARPLSAPTPSDHPPPEPWSITSPACQPEELHCEEATYQNIAYDSLDLSQWSSGLSSAEDRQEGDYDVLPLRNMIRVLDPSAEMDKSVYDFPLSYRRSMNYQDPTESIYDVPSSLLRKMSDHTIDEQVEEETYWTI